MHTAERKLPADIELLCLRCQLPDCNPRSRECIRINTFHQRQRERREAATPLRNNQEATA